MTKIIELNLCIEPENFEMFYDMLVLHGFDSQAITVRYQYNNQMNIEDEHTEEIEE